jgi:hypothetical protein
MMVKTANGENALDGTGNKSVDLFYNIGSARNSQERVEELFKDSLKSDPITTGAILAWARDARGGAGERFTFRNLLRKLIGMDKKLAEKLIRLAPQLGRYDDLRSALNTPLQDVALEAWKNGLEDGNELAYKWVNIKKDNLLRKHLGLSPREFRKKIVSGRPNIVEKKMCAKEWSGIEYEKVPSVAMNKHKKAFRKNDSERFEKWVSDKTEVKASVLYPYQIMKTSYTDDALATKQWNALNMTISKNIIPMIDVSGSMSSAHATSSISCMEVAVSLGVFLAQKNTGSFANKVITFSNNPFVYRLPSNPTSIKNVFNKVMNTGIGYNTDFQKAYQALLNEAIQNNAPQEQLPEYIVVLSDMQMEQATSSQYGWSSQYEVPQFGTAYEKMKSAFTDAGYVIPKVIYWNLNASYGNFPTTSIQDGVALVSGFSPFVMKAIVDANLSKITPQAIMESTIEKYVKLIEN